MKIEEIRREERPRERAARYGIQTLSNRELLALLLKSGYEGVSALDLADSLLSRYTLQDMAGMDFETLKKEKGIKEAKALELLAAFEIGKRLLEENTAGKEVFSNYGDVTLWLRRKIGHAAQEHFLVLFLDGKQRLISHKVLFRGTDSAANISVNQIYREAILQKAKSVICAHNHPGGTLFPSQSDLATTEELIQSGEMLKIPLLDHLIVSSEGVFSIMKYRSSKKEEALLEAL